MVNGLRHDLHDAEPTSAQQPRLLYHWSDTREHADAWCRNRMIQAWSIDRNRGEHAWGYRRLCPSVRDCPFFVLARYGCQEPPDQCCSGNHLGARDCRKHSRIVPATPQTLSLQENRSAGREATNQRRVHAASLRKRYSGTPATNHFASAGIRDARMSARALSNHHARKYFFWTRSCGTEW